MLLVKTTTGPSAIHGTGVFAAEPIPAGTEVWRFTPGFDLDKSPEEIAALPGHVRDFFEHFGWLDRRLGRWILCFDAARFLNHDDDPNLVTDFSREPHGVDVARVDIAPGEELTTDYRVLEERAPDA